VLIQDMGRAKSIKLLQTVRVGRIACARENQPYITPFSFAYHDEYLYSFATVGRKIEWMRANQHWQSVVLTGRFQELSTASEHFDHQALAHDLLARTANWWEPGFVRTVHAGSERALEGVYFRISIDEMTGHRGGDEPTL
jgi:nitroimidazol reductase NimA-like FMN-containing flavoprotein (pyridoxamine 5'-phosphate oxidase superfamily)